MAIGPPLPVQSERASPSSSSWRAEGDKRISRALRMELSVRLRSPLRRIGFILHSRPVQQLYCTNLGVGGTTWNLYRTMRLHYNPTYYY